MNQWMNYCHHVGARSYLITSWPTCVWRIVNHDSKQTIIGWLNLNTSSRKQSDHHCVLKKSIRLLDGRSCRDHIILRSRLVKRSRLMMNSSSLTCGHHFTVLWCQASVTDRWHNRRTWLSSDRGSTRTASWRPCPWSNATPSCLQGACAGTQRRRQPCHEW